MHRASPFLLLALAAIIVPHFADAQRVYIDVSGATFRPYPLAIPRVKVEGEIEEGASRADVITERVRLDLELAGLFQILDPRSFLARADEGITAPTIRFDDWSNVGAEGLLKAQLIAADEGKVRLEVRLFHVTTAEEASRWNYEIEPGAERVLAHRVANDVVHYFTGERGIFDTRLAFVRQVGENKELWISDWDGHDARRVVGGELNMFPTWSPEGDRIAFTSYREGGPDLYITDLGGRVRTLVSGDPMFHGPSWSPDGSRIAYTRTQHGTADVWVIGADGAGARRLTHYDGVIDTSPTWSPDSRRLAFVSNRHGNPHIFLMNADGSEQERLTFQGNYNQTPKWSPRGNAILFMGRDERAVFDLFVVDPDTKEIARLTQDSGQNYDPSWSPNGRHVIFTSNRTGQPRLWIMNANGTGQRQLALPPGSFTNTAWGPLPLTSGPSARKD